MKCPPWPNEDPRKAMEILSQMVNNYLLAQKAGQNLQKVGVAPGYRLSHPDAKSGCSPVSKKINESEASSIAESKEK